MTAHGGTTPQLFGGAYPQHAIHAGVETEVFNYTCQSPGGRCVITQFWLASDPNLQNRTRFWQSTVRIYVDEEVGGSHAAI